MLRFKINILITVDLKENLIHVWCIIKNAPMKVYFSFFYYIIASSEEIENRKWHMWSFFNKKMGANSIDIDQYRCRIGTCAGKNLYSNSFKNKGKPNSIMESITLLSSLLVLSTITQKLLIISGLELNPGPFTLGMRYFMDHSYWGG